MDDYDLQSAVNDALIRQGWDYEDRKRVMFMLRNKKPRERTLKECIDAVYLRYGRNLTAFFADAHAEAKRDAERRRHGGV